MLKERESPEEEEGGVAEERGGAPEGCAGCGGRIHDRYYLLAADRQWHAPCLRCCECSLPLDSELTCFARDRNIYCKEDYYRMFCVKRCARCRAGISASELVMRARELVYHLTCFTCATCGIPLAKGDTFGVRAGLVYCRPHYELSFATLDTYCDEDPIYSPDSFRSTNSPSQYYAVAPVQKGRPRKRKSQEMSPDPGQNMRMSSTPLELLHPSDLNSSMESLSYDSSVASPGSASGRHTQRTKRMRTSFKHHQLRTMKSYFAINQNPDAKDLKQLAQKTGLSKRVLQVWFQNARAKWRRNIMRQEAGGQVGVSQGSGNPGGSSNPSQPPLHHQMQVHHNGSSFADLY